MQVIASREKSPDPKVRERPPSAKEQQVLDRQPRLDMQMLVCIDAWQRLDSVRPLGLRPIAVKGAAPVLVPFRGAIGWDKVRDYGEYHGLGREGVALLAEVIAMLDADRSAEEMRKR